MGEDIKYENFARLFRTCARCAWSLGWKIRSLDKKKREKSYTYTYKSFSIYQRFVTNYSYGSYNSSTLFYPTRTIKPLFFSLNGWKCCSQGKSIRAQNREREREREGGRGMRRRRLLSREQQQADRWISRDFVVVIDTRARSRAVVLLSASGVWIYTGFERVYAVYLHEPRRKTPALSLLGKKNPS